MVSAWAQGDLPPMPTKKAVACYRVGGTDVVFADSCAPRVVADGWSIDCAEVTLSYVPAPSRVVGKGEELADALAQQLRGRAATVHVDTKVACEVAGRSGSCRVLEATSGNGTRVRFTLGASSYRARDFALLCADARASKPGALPPPCARVIRTH